MKNIYLILIVTCLVEQLKADVYTVTVNDFVRIDREFINTTWSEGYTRDVTIYKDLKQGHVSAETALIEYTSNSEEFSVIKDLCNMDTSTKDGTIAAILWGIIGIESCPVAAGKYPIIREFNKTGIIEDIFVLGNETINIVANFDSSNGKTYFQVDVNVHLVEKDEEKGS